ncbi:TylF/MycF family methyltransferase [Skermania piniformis]|uniref:TylF/MycF family methyltransferase n=1 Tax=Skermania pinensis TaxID=39122 RepID=UPI001FE8FF3E|nr:TylF/MycF family methyltransferase [Skermania piniformis]
MVAATVPVKNQSELRERYIELLKRTLTMILWDAADGRLHDPSGAQRPELRIEGRDWPALSHTMIGLKRMDNLQYCVEDVLANGVPGDFIETGVWRGGACVFMRGILEAYGVTDRTVWVADSFEGLPAPDPAKYPADDGDILHTYDALAVTMETVKETFRRYNLLDTQVKMLPGWFKDTLPSAPIEKLAIVRLDGDMYESTMNGLQHLYPKLSVGGYLIVDDYALPACRQAVHDYRDRYGIVDPIEVIDFYGAFWKKVDTVQNDDSRRYAELSQNYAVLYQDHARVLECQQEAERELADLRGQRDTAATELADLRVRHDTAATELADLRVRHDTAATELADLRRRYAEHAEELERIRSSRAHSGAAGLSRVYQALTRAGRSSSR